MMAGIAALAFRTTHSLSFGSEREHAVRYEAVDKVGETEPRPVLAQQRGALMRFDDAAVH